MKKYIDFLGTSYNEKRRPATFNHGHVVRYLKRVENGLWMFGPEHLEELLKAGDIKAVDGALRFNRSEDAQQYRKFLRHTDDLNRVFLVNHDSPSKSS